MSEPGRNGRAPSPAQEHANDAAARLGNSAGSSLATASNPAGASGSVTGMSAQPDTPGSAADLLPSVTLPKGGGAIRGLEEKLSVDAATGTASMTVQLPLSPGRSGFTPPLRLGYDSATGNGPVGFGWSLGAPAITRKTSKGLPRYCDGAESDVFVLAGADDLVPVLDQAGSRLTVTRTVYGAAYEVAFYRPRVEGLFSRVERWTATGTGISHWRTISRDNVTALYGADPGSTVANPADPAQIFSWQICRSWDDQGNAATYSYAAEDGAGIDQAAAHEANRTPQARAAQIYLRTVQYGNIQPYVPDWTAPKQTPLPADWAFKIVLDYGDHAAVPPTPEPDQPWPVRPDPFSTYRPGFEVRTYRRVQRLLFFNDFPAEPTAGASCLVRSVDLTYSDQQLPPDPASPIYTFVVSVTQTGYRADGELARILRYTADPVVSADIVRDPASCIFDSLLTQVVEGRHVHIFGWYDNEWGFSSRHLDTTQLVGGATA